MQVNSVGRHLGMLGLYYSNVTAMFANTDFLGGRFQVLSNRSASVAPTYPVKEQLLPLRQWGQS